MEYGIEGSVPQFIEGDLEIGSKGDFAEDWIVDRSYFCDRGYLLHRFCDVQILEGWEPEPAGELLMREVTDPDPRLGL